jgi:4-amino-4-deoxy-L-arabinose transferase-like glycosyltransferase
VSRSALLVFAAFSILLFGTLGLRPLYKADESRYAEIPREMVASGDWLTPRLNGLKYFEKPPLQYWATAAFFELFGESDAVSRLWTALAAVAGIALVFFSGRRLFGGEAGAFGALVLAGSPLYVLLAQVNTLDMALTFFLSAAIFAFALGRYYLFWAACAAAVLSKGLIGIVLPAGAIGLYVLLKRDFSLLRRMKPVRGTTLFLVLSAPWFIAVSAANPEFAHFFFVQEHFQRFTTKMHERYEPFWYFIPVLALGIAPWLLSLAFSARRQPAGGRSAERIDPALFLWIWAAVVFLFFSVSDSKLPSYILPIFPALAALIGAALASGRQRALLAWQAALAVLVGVALAVAAPLITARIGSMVNAVPWLVAAGLALASGASASVIAAWRGRPQAAAALLSIASFACVFAVIAGHARSPYNSSRAQIAALGTGPSVPVFAVDFYDHTLPWYFRRTVTMVGYKDELAQAIAWEPAKFIPDLAGFERAWAAAPAAYAVFSARDFPNLQKQLSAPMEIVSRGARYVIVRKP